MVECRGCGAVKRFPVGMDGRMERKKGVEGKEGGGEETPVQGKDVAPVVDGAEKGVRKQVEVNDLEVLKEENGEGTLSSRAGDATAVVEGSARAVKTSAVEVSEAAKDTPMADA